MKELVVVRDFDCFIAVEQEDNKDEGVRVVFHDWGDRSCASTLITEDEFEDLTVHLARALLAAEENEREALEQEIQKVHRIIDRIAERYLRRARK